MKLSILKILGLGLVLAGCATSKDVREIPTRVSEMFSNYHLTGDSLSCVETRSLRSFKVIDEDLILAEVAGGKMLINQPTRPCVGAEGPSRYIEFSSRSGRLCRGDVIRIADKSLSSVLWSCSIGDFQVLEEKPSAS